MCLDTIHFHPRLFDTPITVAKMIAGMMECGPLPYMSRSEVDLHITDNILTKDDKGLTFKDFDVCWRAPCWYSWLDHSYDCGTRNLPHLEQVS